MTEYFKTETNDSTLLEWKSKALPNKIIKPPNINLASSIVFYDTRILLKFNRSNTKFVHCLSNNTVAI